MRFPAFLKPLCSYSVAKNNLKFLQPKKPNKSVPTAKYSVAKSDSVPKMGDELSYAGMPLPEIIKSLEEFAPLSLAESWDNVGLLVDPMTDKAITTVMLTNDLTENVLDEAISHKAGLIISYHPPIFQGLKSVTSRTWKERQVIKSIKNGIAIYSPHTSWDSVVEGVNDWLANSLPIENCRPIKATPDDPNMGAGRFCEMQAPIAVGDACERIKRCIGIPHLRLALAKDKNEHDHISTVALCAGSGASVLNGVQADLYLTGEMLHHDVLDANQNGTHVILCNHSDSERGFLRTFHIRLQREILKNSVKVIVSEIDCDPLKTV